MKVNTLERCWTVTFFKGIAIIMVILVHAAQRFSLPLWSTMLPKFSQMGCQIFFVLSAFTLCLSLDKKKDGFMAFMRKRMIRIAPGYWSMIIIYLCLATVSYLILDSNIFNTETNIYGLLSNAIFIHGLLPTRANNLVVRGGWFVGTIVIFYLLTPLLYKIYNQKNPYWEKIRYIVFPLLVEILTDSFIILIIMVVPSLDCGNNSYLYFSFINQFGCYSLGFSLFDLYKNKGLDDSSGYF